MIERQCGPLQLAAFFISERTAGACLLLHLADMTRTALLGYGFFTLVDMDFRGYGPPQWLSSCQCESQARCPFWPMANAPVNNCRGSFRDRADILIWTGGG